MIEKRWQLARSPVIAFLALALVFATVACGMRFFVYPRTLFERHVIRPIPASVRNMKADIYNKATFWARRKGYQARASVVRFDISREDLLQIVAARGFKPWENVDYRANEGTLWYRMAGDPTTYTDAYLYRGRYAKPPSWFDLDKWQDTDMETYLTGQDDYMKTNEIDVSLLIYNSQLGSAYLIRWERRSPR
jgi:hypothetical protein